MHNAFKTISAQVGRFFVVVFFLLFVPSFAMAQAGGYDTRIIQLEDQLRAMTDTNERLSHQVRLLTEKLDRLQKETNLRFEALEGGGVSTASAPKTATSPSPAASADDDAVPAPNLTGAPQEQYQQAFSLVTQKKYPEAAAALQAFVKKNPKDPLAGNAQYWLGETYYVRGQYEDASRTFMSGYQNYPQNVKAPDSLLKLGLSLAQLGKNKEACVAYKQLITKHSSMSAELKRRVTAEQQRLGCS